LETTCKSKLRHVPYTDEEASKQPILLVLVVVMEEEDSVFNSINQKMHVGGIFGNLAKALDCVNHEILLAKSHFYGIQ
jgi:hypothetical protein